MSNWMITWLNKGKYKGQEIIPENYIEEAMSSQMVVYAGLPDKENPDIHFGNYGYGWFLNEIDGNSTIEHGGGIPGFLTDAIYLPKEEVFVAAPGKKEQLLLWPM